LGQEVKKSGQKGGGGTGGEGDAGVRLRMWAQIGAKRLWVEINTRPRRGKKKRTRDGCICGGPRGLSQKKQERGKRFEGKEGETKGIGWFG